MVFFVDILIYSKSEEEHTEHSRMVLCDMVAEQTIILVCVLYLQMSW